MSLPATPMSAAPLSTYIATSEGLTQNILSCFLHFSKISFLFVSKMEGQLYPASSNIFIYVFPKPSFWKRNVNPVFHFNQSPFADSYNSFYTCPLTVFLLSTHTLSPDEVIFSAVLPQRLYRRFRHR